MFKSFALNFPKRSSSKSGFSLVEVVLSLGVIAFAFTTMIGLLTIGIFQSHAAINTSVTAQIVQKVMNEIQQTDFYTLIMTPSTSASTASFRDLPVRYFDYAGAELTSSAGALYQVHVRIQTSVLLPGSTTPSTSSTFAEVTVQVANNPANIVLTPNSTTLLWPSTTSGVTVTNYSTQVAGSNQEL